MIAPEQAKKILSHYPSLRWIGQQWGDFSCEPAGDGIKITPKDGTLDDPTAYAHFPVVIAGDETVSLPSFEIADYPNDAARATIKKPPPADAIVFLCDLFYSPTGHTYFYLHYPTHPADDRLIHFNAGKARRDKSVFDWKPDYLLQAAHKEERIEWRGANSFIGFPVSAAQAKTLEADCAMTMANKHFNWNLFNWGTDGVNCTGFCLTRLQNIGIPLSHLTHAYPTVRNIDNDHLPDYLLADPWAVLHSIEHRVDEATAQKSLDVVIDNPVKADEKYLLRLAKTPEGELVGYAEFDQPKMSEHEARERYLAFDVQKLLGKCLPQIMTPEGGFKDLDHVKIGHFALGPINTHRHSVIETIAQHDAQLLMRSLAR